MIIINFNILKKIYFHYSYIQNILKYVPLDLFEDDNVFPFYACVLLSKYLLKVSWYLLRTSDVETSLLGSYK